MTLFDCPACGARVNASPVDPAEGDAVCDAPFPDTADTRCLMRPHAGDEHDPEHRGVNPQTGATITWRSSEYGP